MLYEKVEVGKLYDTVLGIVKVFWMTESQPGTVDVIHVATNVPFRINVQYLLEEVQS